MFSVENVEEIIRSTPKKNGVYNIFFPITEKVGLKLSQAEKARDNLYARQELAAEHNLGPDVFGKIKVWYEDEIYYGYFTEIVEVIEDINDMEYTEYQSWINLFNDEIDILADNLRKIGIQWYDQHIGNIGLKGNNLVCIDFDNENEDRVSYLEFEEEY